MIDSVEKVFYKMVVRTPEKERRTYHRCLKARIMVPQFY